MKSVNVIEGIVVLAIIVPIILFFSIPQTIFSTYTSIKVIDLTDTTLTFGVVHSDPINIKNYVGLTGRLVVGTSIEGDNDLPVSSEICNKWGGSYSASQGCSIDVNQIPNLPNVEIFSNNLYFQLKNNARVGFYEISNGEVRLQLPSPQQMGCTQADIDNDVCVGYVKGSFSFRLIPDECSSGEVNYYTCWDDSKVQSCTCVDGQWDCIISPETQCPEQPECTYDSDCYAPAVIVENGRYVASCVDGECRFDIICNDGYELEGNSCEPIIPLWLIVGVILILGLGVAIAIFIYKRKK